MYLDIDLDPHTRQDNYGVDNITNTDALELQIDSLLYPAGYMSMQEFQRNYWFELRYGW